MKIAIHQPYYLPWPGYFHKMSLVDKWVVLDNAQYTRGQHFNRTQIMVQGVKKWLTVPTFFEPIQIGQVNTHGNAWNVKHEKTLLQSYAKCDFYAEFKDLVQEGCRRVGKWQKLWMVDMVWAGLLMEKLKIDPIVILESGLDAKPALRSQRLVNICQRCSADTYVSGTGGSKGYLDLDLFAENNIKVLWQEFHFDPYRQRGVEEFMPGLSVMDLIANCGIDYASRYIRECGTLRDSI